ncbi:MAG: hypothetical protein AB4041_20675 [Microcystaceae cyanobacterium]
MSVKDHFDHFTPFRSFGEQVCWFRVSGIRCRVSGFGFRVSGFGFQVSGFGYSPHTPHHSIDNL